MCVADNYFSVATALRIAKKYYDNKGYEHALRVAGYVAQNTMIPLEIHDFCVALAIMHDLCEDTDFSLSEINNDRMCHCLRLISKDKNVGYIIYCKNIKENSEEYPEVYWAKIGDMKDHLAEKETLTDRLKEKYLTALPYLL